MSREISIAIWKVAWASTPFAVHTATHPADPITTADRYEPTGDSNVDDLLAALEREAAEEKI